MKGFIRHLFTISFSAFARRVYLKITGKEYLVTGKCNYCGKCCEGINLRSGSGWIRHKHEFSELVKKFPEYNRFSVVSKDSMGYLQFICEHLDPGNGCRDYNNRPDICKRYPSKSLVLQGGKLIEGCGYTIQIGTSFEKHLSTAIQQKNPGKQAK
jgi:Fe-S-cluster containining protein